MVDDLPDNAQEPDRSPAGTPAEHRAVDRRWRLWAAGVVVLALSLAGLLGLVIIPAGQREDAGVERLTAPLLESVTVWASEPKPSSGKRLRIPVLEDEAGLCRRAKDSSGVIDVVDEEILYIGLSVLRPHVQRVQKMTFAGA